MWFDGLTANIQKYLWIGIAAICLLFGIVSGTAAWVYKKEYQKAQLDYQEQAKEYIVLQSENIGLKGSIESQNRTIEAMRSSYEINIKTYQKSLQTTREQTAAMVEKYKNMPECDALKAMDLEFLKGRE